MTNLLLFAPRSIQAGAVSKTAVDARMSAASPARPSDSGPFAISQEAWTNLARMVPEGLDRVDVTRHIIAMGPFSSSALPDAWWGFINAAGEWDRSVRPGLQVLADDIISYAHDTAPQLYGQLAERLRPLEDRPPSKEEADACVVILAALAQAADQRAQRAVELSRQVAPFAEAVRRFGDAFAQHERNPAVRVMLPDIPFMCLSYGDDGLACAGDVRNSDKRQFWVVDFQPQKGAYTFTSVADPDRVLIVDQDPRLIELGNMRVPFGIAFFNEGPRPRMEVRGNVTPGGVVADAALFRIPPFHDRYIQNVNYNSLTLDCAGDDGWQQGTPVLAFLKNGGANQHWSFDPPLRRLEEIDFHDIVEPVGVMAGQVSGLQHLQGDWAAIADDMRAGVAHVLSCVELNQPFIAGLQVDEVLSAWSQLAQEAAAASNGLRQ